MSAAGIRAKKKWSENYFIKHPDSRTVQIVGSSETFPALFDYAFMNGNKDGGNVEQQKRVPHLTFYSLYEKSLTPRSTQVDVPVDFDENDLPTRFERFTVYKLSSDLTEETYQAEAWLV